MGARGTPKPWSIGRSQLFLERAWETTSPHGVPRNSLPPSKGVTRSGGASSTGKSSFPWVTCSGDHPVTGHTTQKRVRGILHGPRLGSAHALRSCGGFQTCPQRCPWAVGRVSGPMRLRGPVTPTPVEPFSLNSLFYVLGFSIRRLKIGFCFKSLERTHKCHSRSPRAGGWLLVGRPVTDAGGPCCPHGAYTLESRADRPAGTVSERAVVREASRGLGRPADVCEGTKGSCSGARRGPPHCGEFGLRGQGHLSVLLSASGTTPRRR